MKEYNRGMVAMSGGVDSSVAAYLAKEQTPEVIGVTMKLFHTLEGGPVESSCCSLSDVEDARSIAEALGVPHYVFNLSDSFEEKVIRKFVQAYEIGATPNPCIDCNRYIKFEALYRKAQEMDCTHVITGHYARVRYNDETGRYELWRARDLSKDQTYFLYTLSQDQLKHTRFPLGDMKKSEVRQLAEEQGFRTAGKKDSQDICFVDNSYSDFIRRYTGKEYPEGDFLDTEGRVLGRHRGLINYTIGQRKGLGIAASEPLYVIRKSREDNAVILSGERDLFSKGLVAEDINPVAVEDLKEGRSVQAKTRYSHQGAEVFAYEKGGRLYVEFKEPQRAITQGQGVVLYDGDVVLAGGTILSALN